MSKTISRRTVVHTGVVGAASVTLKPLAGPALGALGANERIRLAVVGAGWRGGQLIDRFAPDKGVEIVYVADPDTRLVSDRLEVVRKQSEGRSKPKGIQDAREALDDKRVDAVAIATPNHWHVLMTIWACQADKDVYVEKPLSHDIHEGRMVVQAARKHRRIVQHGTQSRSDMKWAKVAAAVKSGKLGKLRVARGLCYNASDGFRTRASLGFKPVTAPPRELDFNLWQGPAKWLGFHENLVHYRWHWFWATGNGDIGNQGVHQLDILRWCIPNATLPRSVVSFGGRLGYEDQGEVASTQVAVMDFGETQLVFEVRGLPSKPYRGQRVGTILHLDEGTIVEGKFYPNGSKQPVPLPDVGHERGPGGDHFGNFLAAMRSRKVSDLNGDVLEGHNSAALCHLANMSIRLGLKVPFTPRTQALADTEAVDALKRMETYLKENGIDIERSGYVMGRKLAVDTEAERIIDDEEANALLSRDYRKGFEVPQRIA